MLATVTQPFYKNTQKNKIILPNGPPGSAGLEKLLFAI